MADNALSFVPQIKEAHLKVAKCHETALQNAIMAGSFLNLAQENLKETESKEKWEGWSVKHCGIPQTTASLYMRMAKGKEFLDAEEHQKKLNELKGDKGYLSLRAADAFITPLLMQCVVEELEALPTRTVKEEKRLESLKERLTKPKTTPKKAASAAAPTPAPSPTPKASPLVPVEEISRTLCTSGHSPDDLFKVAIEIIKHVVNDDTPQAQLIAYQKAIAELWPIKPQQRKAA